MAVSPRVLMVVRLFHPWIGGTERQALKLSRALAAAGSDVRIVTGRWFRGTPRSERIEGVEVFRHHTLWEFFGIRGMKKFGGYLYILTLAWHLFRTRDTYDVIHVHGLNYHTAVAATVGRRLGKPTIAKLANSGIASDIDRMRRGQQLAGAGRLLGAALRCDRLVALSPVIADELRRAGVSEERIVSIPNGVEVDETAAPRRPESDVLRLVYIGRLHPQKGVDVLLEACALAIPRLEGRLSLRIVGDGPARSPLEDQAKALRLQGVVEFVGEVGDPMPEIDGADVFVLPSRTEGMSNALLEAMSRCRTVVATAVSGSQGLVSDGRSGLLVEPENPAQLADTIERLSRDREECLRLAETACSEIRRHYSLEQVAARYADLYVQLVEAARAEVAAEVQP
jgi:glycosyltransferase involved in cell wall biosynthesis